MHAFELMLIVIKNAQLECVLGLFCLICTSDITKLASQNSERLKQYDRAAIKSIAP